jgi:PKD repeat protein
MQTAGWTECGSSDRASADYLISPGLLTLISDWDNNTSPAVCWNKIPSGISNWSVSTREAWVGDNDVDGTIQIIVTTTSHTYNWDADGFFQRYILWRDGYGNGGVWSSSYLYKPQLYVWHDLRMDFVNGTFHLYFDDLPLAAVPVQDTGTNITGIILRSPAGTDNSFSNVQVNSVNPNAPDFTLVAGPISQNIPVGQNATFTVSLASINGFSGTVDLATTVSPGGSNSLVIDLSHTVSLASDSSVSTNLTVATLLVISASTFNIRVNATSGTLFHSILVTATVTNPAEGESFILRASPGSLVVRQNGNGTWNNQNITVSLTGVSGFDGTVMLSAATNSSEGPVAVIEPSQLLITGNRTFASSFVITRDGSGAWSFTITASTAGVSTITSVVVDFIPSRFYASVTPSGNILVPFGSSTTFYLNLESQNGYDGAVSFSYSSFYLLPANPPIISFSPNPATPIPNETLSVPVTISTSTSTPTGSYAFSILSNGGWWYQQNQINVYVVAQPYSPGVEKGTTATYSVSLSSYPGVPISVTLEVTNVTGPVVSYTEAFYVDNVLSNTTSGSISIVTGDQSGTVFVPFPFVASGLNPGDSLFPAATYGSISVTSTSTDSLAGRSRSTFSAGTGLTINPVQFTATWDSSTGILGTLDGTVPINSTSVTAHYVLISTNAWGASNPSSIISVEFTFSPSQAVQFSIITFNPTVTGGTPPYSYRWNFGDGQSSSQSNPDHSYASPGSYQVTLTVTDKNGVVATQTSTIKVSSSTITLPVLGMLAPTPRLIVIGLIVVLAYVAVAITVAVIVVRRERVKQSRLVPETPYNT